MYAVWRGLIYATLWLHPRVTYGLSNSTLALPVGNAAGNNKSNIDHSGNVTIASAEVEEYMIWPPTQLSVADSTTLEEFVSSIAPSFEDVYVSTTPEGEACFIVANLTKDVALKAGNHSLVDTPTLSYYPK